MPNTDHHATSLRTRRQIEEVLYKHGLDMSILRKYGTLDRIVKGYKLAKDGFVDLKWVPDPFKMRTNEWPITAEVRSATEKGQKYLVGVVLETNIDDVFAGDKEGIRTYEVSSIGDSFSHAGIHINAHTCEDSFYQGGLKKLPVKCKHCVAASMFVPMAINRALQEEVDADKKTVPSGVEVREMYSTDLDELERFCDELDSHNVTAARRLDILYRFAKGYIGHYELGRGFMKSIGL